MTNARDVSAGIEKTPFDAGVALARIREAIRPFPKAALFELADDGFGTVFQQVVACIISTRTYDEVTLTQARRLLTHAADAAAIAALPPDELDALIHQASFHEAKARHIQAIARLAVDRYDGELPCDEAVLLSLPGVGHTCWCGELPDDCAFWQAVAERLDVSRPSGLRARLPVCAWPLVHRQLEGGVVHWSGNVRLNRGVGHLARTAVDLAVPVLWRARSRPPTEFAR